MALGLNTGGGGADFLPIVVFDARAGRLFKVERTQGATGWQSERVDITQPAPSFAVDMGSIQVGWMHFGPTGPDFQMVPLGHALPPRPTNEHKQGFKVKIAGRTLDGLREFSHSAKCVLSALDELHTAFEASPEAAQGKIPVVKLASTRAVVTSGPQGKTTNYAPVFEIVTWTDRMPEMGERTVPAPGGKVHPQTHAANGETLQATKHVPPPAAKTAPAMPSQDDWN